MLHSVHQWSGISSATAVMSANSCRKKFQGKSTERLVRKVYKVRKVHKVRKVYKVHKVRKVYKVDSASSIKSLNISE
jgi:hypothetical protein